MYLWKCWSVTQSVKNDVYIFFSSYIYKLCHCFTSRAPPEGSWRSQPQAPQAEVPQRSKRPLIPESQQWNLPLRDLRSTAQDPKGSKRLGYGQSREYMQREICVVVVCVEYDRMRERWLCIGRSKSPEEEKGKEREGRLWKSESHWCIWICASREETCSGGFAGLFSRPPTSTV